MGNKNNTAHNIFVSTDKGYYLAGETVTGHVYLDLKKEYAGREVVLKVRGREQNDFQARVYSDNHNGGRKEEKKRVASKTVFFSHRVVIYSWPQNCMPPGQYSFPFTFLLTAHLPGTFKEKKSEYEASIEYKIKAECVPLNSNNNNKLKHSQELIIREPLKTINNAMFRNMLYHPVTCCCCSQGETRLHCHFDSNNYQPGEEATIIITVDNGDCKVSIADVRVSLIRQLYLISSTGHQEIYKTEVTKMCLGQVQKHTVQDEISSLKGTLLLTAKGKKDAEPLQPSTTGLLVRCQYSVVISVQADGCTCCRQPEILQVPISIVAPPPLNYGVVDKPADWQPTKFATSEITFREQDMYKSQKDMQQQQQSLVYVPPQRYTLDVAAQQNQGYPNMYQQMGQPPHMNKNYQHLDSCVSETGTFYTQDTSAQKPTYNYPPLPDSQQQLK